MNKAIFPFVFFYVLERQLFTYSTTMFFQTFLNNVQFSILFVSSFSMYFSTLELKYMFMFMFSLLHAY